MTAAKRKPGRPYGQKYCKAIRVRFPPEVDAALRKVRQIFGISLAQQVRAGVVRSLADKILQAVAVAKDPSASNRKKLTMIMFLRTVAEADLALHHPEMAEQLRQIRIDEKEERRLLRAILRRDSQREEPADRLTGTVG